MLKKNYCAILKNFQYQLCNDHCTMLKKLLRNFKKLSVVAQYQLRNDHCNVKKIIAQL